MNMFIYYYLLVVYYYNYNNIKIANYTLSVNIPQDIPIVPRELEDYELDLFIHNQV